MGILDRLRGTSAAQAAAASAVRATARPSPAPEAAPAAPTAPASAPATAAPRGWAALPPIQRASAAPARQAVAASDFSRTLATWQNPTFMGTLSHAVLDGAPTGVL